VDPFIARQPHVVSDSFEFKDKLESLSGSLPPSAKLMCVDLKDFFLSGDPDTLSKDVSSVCVDPDLRPLLREALYMVLNNQYVIASSLPHWYKCIAGAGIGLSHSASVANTAFTVAVESSFLGDLSAHGILVYLRYHDDIFVACQSMQHLKDFMKFFKSRLKYFKAKVREISSTQVEFLDLTILNVGGRLQATPTLTKRPLPLCVHSCHRAKVHKAWPRALIQRAFRLGDLSAARRVIDNYKAANAHPATLSLMTAALNELCQDISGQLPGGSSTGVQIPKVAAIFRYHPAFEKAMQIALRAVPIPPVLNLSIMPSWTNSLPSLSTTISHLNDTLGRGSLESENQAEGVSLLLPQQSTRMRIAEATLKCHGAQEFR